MKRWLWGILFLTILTVLLTGFAPLLVEELVLPPVLTKAGLTGYNVSISRLDWRGCSLHIRGQSKGDAPVITGTIQVDWTPSGLLHRRIQKVSGYGLLVNLVNVPSKKEGLAQKPEHPGSNVSFPVIVDKVEIYSGAVVFQVGEQIVYRPFSLTAKRTGTFVPGEPAVPVQIQLTMESREGTVNTALTIDLAQGTVRGALDANVSLDSLALILPIFSDKKKGLEGTASVKADFEAQLIPFALEQFTAEIVSDTIQVTGGTISLTNPGNESAKLTISGKGTAFLVHGAGLQLERPVPTGLELEARITVAENELEWEGNLEFTPEKGTVVGEDFLLQEAAKLNIFHSGKTNNEQATIHLATGIAGDTERKRSVKILYQGIAMAVGEYDLDAHIKLERQSESTIPSLKLFVQGNDISVLSQYGTVTVPGFALRVQGRGLAGQGDQHLSAMLNLDGADLALQEKGLNVQGIHLRLPLSLPPAEDAQAGNIRVKTVRISGRDLANLEADIHQKGETLVVNGQVKTDLLPENAISLSGTIRKPEKKQNIAELSFSLRDGLVDMEKIAQVFPTLDGVKGSAKLEAWGKMSMSPYTYTGEVDLTLSNGMLQHTETGAALEDIRFRLHFPEFPRIRSAPRQQLAVGTVRKDKIVAHDLKTWFEIESPSSVFIEEISGRWSGGRVFTSSFRLQQGQDELDVALFCDRLKLSLILSQFNLAEADGEGRLSGRIPLVYHDGDFFVDDGFLFSTPGEKGHLKIKQSKYLETTIPADVPHFSPLQFAGAALADFEYNWAKVHLTSEEENLLLQLQVDGKPKDKLPFRFDTKKNAFVRLDDVSKGGLDQPLKLDVNFNVPLNEMLQYKDRFMPLLKQIN